MQREAALKMEAKAYLKYARISPRKVQFVLDLIRGKDTGVAMAILKNTPRGASPYLIKLLGSAIANAEQNFHMDTSKLYVSECFVCAGPTLKRLNYRAKGSADRINKRTCHVTIAVSEKA
jgi:large subunit ribosomal protein L22